MAAETFENCQIVNVFNVLKLKCTTNLVCQSQCDRPVQVLARNLVPPSFGVEPRMVVAASEVPHIQELHMVQVGPRSLELGPHIQELELHNQELHNLELLLEDHSLEHQVGLHNQVLGLHRQEAVAS